MNIAVIALGKIGLPLAVQFASKGHHVVGVDVSERVVQAVNSGMEPFPGEAELEERLAEVVQAGRLRATTDAQKAVASSEAVVVVVPLFVDDEGLPAFTSMDAATRAIAEGIRPGTLVSYETTLPVGTTRERLLPMIEKMSGLRAGDDFFLVFSPERVLTGRVFSDLRRYPKLVGGVDEASTKRGVTFYESVLDFDDRRDLARTNGVWDLGSSEAAEFAKLAETTYRDVNIGLANQFARFADKHGINVFDVIEASNSQPFSHIHRPGIAVGGHCIPIYPRLYLWRDADASIVRAAREANSAMPGYAVGLLAQVHGDLSGQSVVVLGAAYRGGVKEAAFSGVFETVARIRALGANVVVHDVMFSDDELVALGFSPYHLGERVDAAIVQADHPEYRVLASSSLPGVRTVVDGRHVLDPLRWPDVTVKILGAG